MILQQENFKQGYTLFLDRDGVINERIIDGYVLSWDQFRFLPQVMEALNGLAKIFNRIIVVTNQQGVGKGLMTEAELATIHKCMIREIEENGGRIDRVLFCPDLENSPDNCRKPGKTLALRAREIFPEIRFEKSVMVGDSPSDMIFAASLGMRSVFIDGGDMSLAPGNAGCDKRFGSLYGFFCWLKNQNVDMIKDK